MIYYTFIYLIMSALFRSVSWNLYFTDKEAEHLSSMHEALSLIPGTFKQTEHVQEFFV